MNTCLAHFTLLLDLGRRLLGETPASSLGRTFLAEAVGRKHSESDCLTSPHLCASSPEYFPESLKHGGHEECHSSPSLLLPRTPPRSMRPTLHTRLRTQTARSTAQLFCLCCPSPAPEIQLCRGPPTSGERAPYQCRGHPALLAHLKPSSVK